MNSLSARIVLALFLAVGFYGLALGVAGGLLFLVYAQVAIWGVFNLRLSLFAIIGAALFSGRFCHDWSASSRPGHC